MKMTQPLFQRLDLSNRRRIFTVGDIHGCFDLLRAGLRANEFDEEQDSLILLGDLVDRGPFNEEALHWCQRPNVHRVRGKHDQMVHDTVRHGAKSLLNHLNNGGDWFFQIDDMREREFWADTMAAAPLALEVKTPGGRNIGFVHADVPTQSWAELETALNNHTGDLAASDPNNHDTAAFHCMWRRDRIYNLRNHAEAHGHTDDYNCEVHGIDHVFFGHTIVKTPITHNNCSWMDTGAFKNGTLTLVDVDNWVGAINGRP